MRSSKATILGAIFLLAISTGISPAYAQPNSAATIIFGYFDSQSWDSVYGSMVENNGTPQVRQVLEQLLSNPASLESVPGLSQLPAEERLLRIQSSIGLDGSNESSGAIDSLTQSAFWSKPIVKSSWGSSSQSSFNVVLASYSSAPIAGYPIYSGRAWQHTQRYNVASCQFTCTIQCWTEFRFTTNPGFQSTNTFLECD